MLNTIQSINQSKFVYQILPVLLFKLTEHPSFISSGHRGRDRMVVGFKTTYAISAYHH